MKFTNSYIIREKKPLKKEKKRKEKKRNQRLTIRGWEQLEQKNLVLVLWEIGIQKTRKLQSRSIAITEPPQQGDRAPAPSLFITFSLISYTWNMVMISSSSFSDFSWGLEFGICLLIPLYLSGRIISYRACVFFPTTLLETERKGNDISAPSFSLLSNTQIFNFFKIMNSLFIF